MSGDAEYADGDDQPVAQAEVALYTAQRALAKASTLEQRIDDLERDINRLQAQTRELDQSLNGGSDE